MDLNNFTDLDLIDLLMDVDDSAYVSLTAEEAILVEDVQGFNPAINGGLTQGQREKIALVIERYQDQL